MWLHRFDAISLYIIYLGAIICDINTIGFVTVSAQCSCRVCDALVAVMCDHSLGDATVHGQKLMPRVKRRNDSAQIYWLMLMSSYFSIHQLLYQRLQRQTPEQSHSCVSGTSVNRGQHIRISRPL